MAKSREDITYRGHRVIANAGGAMIYPQKHGFKADGVEEALSQARTWIDDRYAARVDERRAKHVGTVDDYADALEANPPSAKEQIMLRAHATAPERKLTAQALADAAGWKSHSSANVHYGKLGRAMCEQLGLKVKGDNSLAYTHALGEYDEASSEWQMHEELAEALERLEIV